MHISIKTEAIKTQPIKTQAIKTQAINIQLISIQSMGSGFCRLILVLLFCAGAFAQPSPGDFDEDDIEIVAGEDKTVYEYRQNGVLMMIKVVPKKGLAYYMVPPGGAHYEDLDHQKSLYPQWRIIEW